jgi:S1-C subfamily serine protease
VAKGSPAELVGIQSGDIILSLDGEPMQSVAQFLHAVRARVAETQIQIRIQRSGKLMNLKALLSSLPKEDTA